MLKSESLQADLLSVLLVCVCVWGWGGGMVGVGGGGDLPQLVSVPCFGDVLRNYYLYRYKPCCPTQIYQG